MLSYQTALKLTLDAIHLLGAETVDLMAAVGRYTVQDLFALVDSPSVDVSLKDGYAIQSQDSSQAAPENPIRLEVIGAAAAGGEWNGELRTGQAVRILSGAPLPTGVDAVLSEEFSQRHENWVEVVNDASPGRNILRKGQDIARGQLIVRKGERLTPTTIGLLAAAGHLRVDVIRQPRVFILATGDEVIAPGMPLAAGKLYASNLFTLAAWCVHYGFSVNTTIVGDDETLIGQALSNCWDGCDVLLTSGGAWKGEHDLIVRILDSLGWEKIYHRVKIGPGKAVGFGRWRDKPVFCLPGGPPSNHMAFLQLALPALQKMAGHARLGLPALSAILAEKVCGQVDWTQFIHGRLDDHENLPLFWPIKPASRLQMMAQAEALVMIPEGQAEISAGSIVQVQILK